MSARSVSLLAVALLCACLQSASAAAPTNTEVLGLFNLWNSKLATLDPEQVADLYAPTAVLLPTVSNTVRDTREKIVDYFKYFLKNKPVGKIDSYKVRRPADGVAMLMGIYTFTFEGGSTVQARFSFTYKRQADGKWLIVEHHSSAMPENTVSEISNTFLAWNEALQTNDPAKVADMYAPNAVLLPTLSNIVRNTREEIIDYFVTFLAKGPKGTILEIPGQSPNIRILAPGVAVNSGIYKFEFKDSSVAYARYTYVYVKYGSKWLIAEHQSSVMPEPNFTP